MKTKFNLPTLLTLALLGTIAGSQASRADLPSYYAGELALYTNMYNSSESRIVIVQYVNPGGTIEVIIQNDSWGRLYSVQPQELTLVDQGQPSYPQPGNPPIIVVPGGGPSQPNPSYPPYPSDPGYPPYPSYPGQEANGLYEGEHVVYVNAYNREDYRAARIQVLNDYKGYIEIVNDRGGSISKVRAQELSPEVPQIHGLSAGMTVTYTDRNNPYNRRAANIIALFSNGLVEVSIDNGPPSSMVHIDELARYLDAYDNQSF